MVTVVNELKWDEFHLIGHSMGGIVGSCYNLLFGYNLRSLVLLDIPGIWALNLDTHENALKMALIADLEEDEPMFRRRPKERDWETWVRIVTSTRNGSVEFGQGDQWFPERHHAEEWMCHTMEPGALEGNWRLRGHPRWKLPYPLYSLPNELMFHLAREATTPLMRIHARTQPKWKLDVSRPEINEAFFSILKEKTKYLEEHTVDGTHMLPITNPDESGSLIRQFIQTVEKRHFS